jgi:YfiH family protein
MITPPDRVGVAFSDGNDGDLRRSVPGRERAAELLGIRRDWARVDQVHGGDVLRVDSSGNHGPADALWATQPGLPLAVFTADCFGVVLHADGAVGIAHAGWRGARAGIVARLRAEMIEEGFPPTRAEVGPGIGPCCFEVGAEVAVEFPKHVATTSWGTRSVDLPGAIGDQLEGLDVWRSGACTLHEDGWFSHRSNGTPDRLAALGWVP